MFTRKSIYFHVLMIFFQVLVSGVSGFADEVSSAGDDMNSPEVFVGLVGQQPPLGSVPEFVENGYQRVYTKTMVPVTIEQLEEMRQSRKTPDIDPETGAIIIESFRDYLPENWIQEGPTPEKLMDSYGNPIVNQTPGLVDWAQRDVDALRAEIENSIEQYWSANASELKEIEWSLGNFISQAIVRKIEFKDLVELSNRDVVSNRVADSIIGYLHFYENLKYSRSLGGKFTYAVSEYDKSVEEFVLSRSQTLESVMILEDPDEGSEGSRGATPSGCYSRSTFTRGMTNLSGATVIWNGADNLFPNDESANVPIGFNFVFYGCEDYDHNSHVRVSTNGYISFYQQGGGAEDGIDYSNDPITSATDPDGYAAAWWDDMIVNNQGSTDKIIYQTEGSAPTRTFTVEYHSISRYLGEDNDFHYYQIKLFEADGRIEFHYGDLWISDTADNATIGMENYAGSDGDYGPNIFNTNAGRPSHNYRFIPNCNIWYGWIDSTWDNVNNWEPNRLPTGTISAIIPNRGNDPSVDSEEFCDTLNVMSGAVLTMPNAQINVYGDIINNGTIENLGALYTDIVVRDNCTISGNGIWSNLDFEILSGTTTLTTSFETRSFSCLSGAVFNNTGSILNTITTTKDLYNGGTINVGSTWYIGGNYSGSGTFNAGTSAVYFNGSTDSHISDSPTFYNLAVEKTGGATTYLDTDLDVSHALYLYSGNLDINGHTLTSQYCTIYDHLINNTGIIDATVNGPYFHSGSNYTCNAGVINSTGEIKFHDGSTETITGGTIYAGDLFADYYGNFTPTGGTVIFDGSSSSLIQGSPDFYDMSVAKNSSTTRSASDFVVINSLNLVSGTFYPGDHTITVGE